MRRLKNIITICFLCLLSSDLVYAPIGIGVRFGTVVLEKVSPGGVYNIRKLRNIPFVLTNGSSAKQELVIQAEIPLKEGVKKGYEPILDPTWVRVIPDKLILEAGEKFYCDVILAIPDDETLIGKHYQAIIRAQTQDEGFYGLGVVNKFYFSIGVEGPEAVQRAKKKKLLTALNFEVDPDKMFLVVPAGEKVNVKKTYEKAVVMVNKGGTNLVVRLESVDNERGFPIPAGYEFTPNTEFVSFKPERVKVKKRRIKDTKMFIEIPDEEQHRGKKYMFVVKTTPVKPELPVELYTRVFVMVK